MLKSWTLIVLLAAVGLGLLVHWGTRPALPEGVTPQGDLDGATQSLLALAGGITAIGTAIFGVLGKFNDFRKARLDIEAKKLDIEAKKRALDRE